MQADMFGREIKVGALLVYPVRSGSTTYMQALRVTDVVSNGVIGRVEKSSHFRASVGKLVQVFRTERAVLVPEAYKLEAALREYNTAATKFIDKVDTGMARSVETYRELSAAREQARQAGVPA